MEWLGEGECIKGGYKIDWSSFQRTKNGLLIYLDKKEIDPIDTILKIEL